MGRDPCCLKVGLHRGPWTPSEDALLIKYIEAHGEGQWRSLPTNAGLLRCGKSCRLRWMNYLRPDIKRGNITPEEDDLIIGLQALLGNRWSLIARRLSGRTDNEIKNYWNTHLSKRVRAQGSKTNTHHIVSKHRPENRAHRCNNKRQRSVKSNKRTQKIDQIKILEDKNDNNNVDDETENTKIHLPKPDEVMSMVSLTRDSSYSSFETNVSTTTTMSTSASSSQSQSQSQILNHAVIFDPDNIILDVPWLQNNANIVEENEFDDMIMGLCGDDVNLDIIQPHDYHGTDFENQDNSKQFEKLYEEYLDLIKVDHGDIGDKIDDHDNEILLESFIESFLI